MSHNRDLPSNIKTDIKAKVIDVQDYSITPSPKYFIDANVLVFSRYDRYDQERSLSKQGASDARVDKYATYEGYLRSAGSTLYVSPSVIFEFLRTVEIAELRILWACLDQKAAQGDFSGFSIKGTRQAARAQYQQIQTRIVAYLRSIAKQFSLVDSCKPFTDRVDLLFNEWNGLLIDSGDAQLLSDAKEHGITHIISDDADLARAEGITLCTCNSTVIVAARQARLLA